MIKNVNTVVFKIYECKFLNLCLKLKCRQKNDFTKKCILFFFQKNCLSYQSQRLLVTCFQYKNFCKVAKRDLHGDESAYLNSNCKNE